MTVYITVNGIRGRLTMETLPLFEREDKPMPEVKRVSLDEITPDSRNANKGTQRGKVALDTSLQKYGAGRSILLDRNNKIIAGNQTFASAGELGFEDVIIVESDGKSIVAVKRTDVDIDDKDGRELAYADNRVGSLNLFFDKEMLQEDFHSGELDLTPFFTEAEIEKFSNEDHEDDEEWEQDEAQPDLLPENHLQLKVIAGSHEDKIELAQELEGRGYRVTI